MSKVACPMVSLTQTHNLPGTLTANGILVLRNGLKKKYPPWADGPDYVVSYEIAKKVSKRHKEGRLKMFKLEDVAMGIWIDSMKKEGLQVRYERDERFYNEGCKGGYLVAHYQGPSQMLYLWQKLKEAKNAICCGD